MRGTPRCVTRKLKHRNEKNTKGSEEKSTGGGAKVDPENVSAPASSTTGASSSKEKAIKEREDGRKREEGGSRRTEETQANKEMLLQSGTTGKICTKAVIKVSER